MEINFDQIALDEVKSQLFKMNPYPTMIAYIYKNRHKMKKLSEDKSIVAKGLSVIIEEYRNISKKSAKDLTKKLI
jgi:hypothetical protein